jgi:prophage regulatory protein
MTFPSSNQSGFIRIRELVKRVPVAKSTVWQWVQDGKFPRPIKLSKGVTAWPVAAIDEWEAEKRQSSTTA